jgi:hypothetical protein
MGLKIKLPKIVRADGKSMTVRGAERKEIMRKGGLGKAPGKK